MIADFVFKPRSYVFYRLFCILDISGLCSMALFMVKRNIVEIDADKCDGCGICARLVMKEQLLFQAERQGLSARFTATGLAIASGNAPETRYALL